MRSRLSPAHRDLSHINSKIFQAVVLKGTMSRNLSPKHATAGTWDNLINSSAHIPSTRATTPKTACSTRRFEDAAKAHRIIDPQLNDEKPRVSSKRILSTNKEAESPGNWVSIYQRTATLQDINKLGKKVNREKNNGESYLLHTPERRMLKTVPYKEQYDYSSKIGLSSPMTREPQTRTPSQRRHVEENRNLKPSPSKYELMNRSGNTTRYTNGDEPMYSVYSNNSNPRSQLQKFLATSVQNQPMVTHASPRRNHNAESSESHLDYGLNPQSRGKKRVTDQSQERIRPVIETMTPFNPMSKGKKMTPQQSRSPIRQNWFDMPAEDKTTGRGQSLFSYRNYASQVPL